MRAVAIDKLVELVELDDQSGNVGLAAQRLGLHLTGTMLQVALACEPGFRVNRTLAGERGTAAFELELGLRQAHERGQGGEELDTARPFGDEAVGTQGERPLTGRFILVAGNDDHRQLAHPRHLRCPDALEQAVAIQARHSDVGEHEIDARIDQQCLPSGFAVGLLAHFEAAANELDDRRPHHARVVNHEDAWQLVVFARHHLAPVLPVPAQAPMRTTVRPLTRPWMKSSKAAGKASKSIVRVTAAR